MGIISGSIWGSFRGRGHFGDCTDLDLSVVLDKHFDMSTQVNNICESASLAIRVYGKIRNDLDQPTAEKLVHAFVSSLQCRRILGGRKLLVYVRTVVTAIFVMTEED